jgi:hypothetical protein
MTQLECPINDVPQPFTAVKSPFVINAAIRVSAASPLFVKVTACATLLVESACAAKVRERGASTSVATTTPVPLSEAVCVPVESVMLNVPVRVPEEVGTNVIATVQLTCGAKLVPQVFAEILKSPVTAGICSVSFAPTVLEMVIF